MGRQHVIIGRNDTDVRPACAQQLGLLDDGAPGRGMGQTAFRHAAPREILRTAASDHLQIRLPGIPGAIPNAFGHFCDFRVHLCHHAAHTTVKRGPSLSIANLTGFSSTGAVNAASNTAFFESPKIRRIAAAALVTALPVSVIRCV